MANVILLLVYSTFTLSPAYQLHTRGSHRFNFDIGDFVLVSFPHVVSSLFFLPLAVPVEGRAVLG